MKAGQAEAASQAFCNALMGVAVTAMSLFIERENRF